MRRLWHAGVVLAVFVSSALGQPKLAPPPSRPPEPLPQSPLRDLGGGLFELGNVRLDRKARVVSFPGVINMTNQLIEYAIVSGSGKLHESLLRAEAEPYHIHLAMLLLGAKVGETNRANSSLKGVPVEIRINWSGAPGAKSIAIEDWIWNREKKKTLEPGGWIYNGSKISEGVFMAQWEGSIAAIIDDGDALLNNRTKDRENDGIWFPREKVVPAVGTPVRIEIQLKSKATNEN